MKKERLIPVADKAYYATYRADIIDALARGVDQTLEQFDYCDNGYDDSIKANRCADCSMCSYGTDCHGVAI